MLRHALTYFLFRAGNGVVALLSLALLTRWLPAEQYGRYALGISGANVVAALAFQWLNVAVGRFHASKGMDQAKLFRTAQRYAASIGATILTAAVIVESFGLVAVESGGLVLAAAALGVSLGVHGLHLQLLNARQEAMRYGLLSATRAWLALALSAASVWAGGLATAALAGAMAGSTLAILLLGARRPPSVPAPAALSASPEREAGLIRFGLPLSLTYVSIAVIDASDRFMLNHWQGAIAVASYGAAFDLVQQVLGAALNVLYLSAYPKVIEAWEHHGPAAARAAMQPLRNAALTLAPLGALLFGSLAPEVTQLALGTEVAAPASTVMPAIAAAVALSGLRAFCFDVALHLRKATRLHVATTAAMAGLNLALNALLIPKFGAWGAAAASASAFALGAMLSLWFGREVGLFDNMWSDAARASLAMASGWFCIQGTRQYLHTLAEGGLMDSALSRLLLCAIVGIAAYMGVNEFIKRLFRSVNP